MNTSIASETVLVSPDVAQKWLAERPYHGQRQRRDTHVKFLAEEMERDNFLPGTQIAFAVMPTGKMYTVDGQHTLSAIALSGKSQTLNILRLFCQDEEAVAKVYGRIDINLKRTVSDLFAAMGLANELGFTSTQLNFMGAAVKLINTKFRSQRSSYIHADDLVSWISDYAYAGHEYFEIIAGMPKEMQKSLQRSATLGMALVTYRFSKRSLGSKIDDFWSGVAHDDGVKNGDPRKAAHRHLLTAGIMGGGATAGGTHTRKVTAAYSSRYLANCFNAYVEGRSIDNTKVSSDISPIKIIGSPFTGKE